MANATLQTANIENIDYTLADLTTINEIAQTETRLENARMEYQDMMTEINTTLQEIPTMLNVVNQILPTLPTITQQELNTIQSLVKKVIRLQGNVEDLLRDIRVTMEDRGWI